MQLLSATIRPAMILARRGLSHESVRACEVEQAETTRTDGQAYLAIDFATMTYLINLNGATLIIYRV